MYRLVLAENVILVILFFFFPSGIMLHLKAHFRSDRIQRKRKQYREHLTLGFLCFFHQQYRSV